MGREVEAQVHYRSTSGVVRAVLESDALILRGDVRARLARSGLSGWQVDADDLHISTPDGLLVLKMGAAEAAKWVLALNRPLPTLAEKLGVAGHKLWLITDMQDDNLNTALQGAGVVAAAQATMGMAVLRRQADLDLLLAACLRHPDLPVWAINEKGPRAGVPENAIRTALRAIGMVDIKACAVSATLSATLYQRRKA